MEDPSLLVLGAAHVHTPDHLRVAAEEGWRIAAVWDHDRCRAGDAASDRGADILTDLPETDCGASACVVFSETARHAALVLHALDLGLPVFVEKPLAPVAEARRLARRARALGLTLDTGFFLRTNAAIAGARAGVRDRGIGRPVSARFHFAHDGAFADWLDLSGWMTDPRAALYGGFGDEGIHMIDLALWMLGDVATARAVLGHACGFALDDHGIGCLSFESGATAVIEAGWTDAGMRLEIEIVGTEGHLCIRDGRAAITPRGADRPTWSRELSVLDAGEGSRPFLRSLASGRRNSLVAPEDAVRAARVLDLLYTA